MAAETLKMLDLVHFEQRLLSEEANSYQKYSKCGEISLSAFIFLTILSHHQWGHDTYSSSIYGTVNSLGSSNPNIMMKTNATVKCNCGD
jgi:hypothetical protein